MIYRYNHNTLTIDYSYQDNKKRIKITTETFKEFLEDKRLIEVGYIGNNYKLTFNKEDTTVNLRLPIYFREIDAGEIATIEIDKNGDSKIKSIKKYEGFAPD